MKRRGLLKSLFALPFIRPQAAEAKPAEDDGWGEGSERVYFKWTGGPTRWACHQEVDIANLLDDDEGTPLDVLAATSAVIQRESEAAF
jgi:hypothetical protein